MADEDLIVRAAIRDELSGPISDIRGELRELGKESERTERKMGSSARGFDAVDRAARRMSSAAGGLATKALRGAGTAAAGLTVAAGVATGAAVALGVKTAASMENAKIAFDTMLKGSGKSAASFLKDLGAFAAKTPFEFPELQTAASSLISAGIEADKVIPIMTSLGNATSGMGTGSEGVKRATVALQQMNAAGKITGEDLNQLRDAGIPVFDLLAKATGKSKKAVAALAQEGKLGSKELGQMMKALETGKGLERFTGLMDKQSASLSGMWSTAKDTVTQGLGNAVKPAIPAIKRGLNEISNAAGSAFKWVGEHKAEISQFVNMVGPNLKALARVASGVLGPAFKSFGTAGGGAYKLITENSAPVLKFLLDGADNVLQFASGFTRLSSIALRAYAWIMDGTADLIDMQMLGFSKMIGVAAKAWGWVPGLGDKINAANTAVQGMVKDTTTAMRGQADAARGHADVLDNTVKPAIDRARDRLATFGKTEIDKAKLRDSAAKAANSVMAIGTGADGAQLKLKKFSDRTKLTADQQAGLMRRIKDARGALGQQIGALRAAGGGQTEFAAATKISRDNLYAEFRQMGLSKKEAGHLATKYSQIPPKKITKVEAPGLAAAKRDAAEFKNTLDKIRPNKDVTFTTSGGKVAMAGDTATSRARSGSFAHTMAAHAAAGGASGPRISNAFIGGGGRGRGSGDHQAGRALDLVGSGLPGYRAKIKAGGGYAEYHGSGRDRHLHAVPAAPRGDTRTSMARRSGGGSGGHGRPTLVMSPGAVQIDATGSRMTPDELADAVARGIDEWQRDQNERS